MSGIFKFHYNDHIFQKLSYLMRQKHVHNTSRKKIWFYTFWKNIHCASVMDWRIGVARSYEKILNFEACFVHLAVWFFIIFDGIGIWDLFNCDMWGFLWATLPRLSKSCGPDICLFCLAANCCAFHNMLLRIVTLTFNQGIFSRIFQYQKITKGFSVPNTNKVKCLLVQKIKSIRIYFLIFPDTCWCFGTEKPLVSNSFSIALVRSCSIVNWNNIFFGSQFYSRPINVMVLNYELWTLFAIIHVKWIDSKVY